MADNLASLKIAIDSGGVKKATDELNNLSTQSAKTEKSVGTLSDTFNSMKTTAVAVGLAGISYEVSKLAKEGIKLNSQFEQMKLGIASLIAVNSANISSTGKSITAIEKFTMAQNQAREAVELLKKANLQTPATLMQITEGYQAALGPALRLGLSVKQTVEYVRLMTMAAASMGAPMNQIAQESRALLSGEIDMNAQVARNLQITNEQIKMHTKQGDLYQFLTSKLQDFASGGDAMSKSWEGVTSNLEESWQTLEMALTKDIFESFKVGILDVNKYLSNTKEVMSDIHTITDYAKAIAEITIALGAVKVTFMALTSAQKIYNAYLLATTIQTTAYSLATNTTTISLARMTLGQYAATLATKGWTAALKANPLVMAATAIVAGIYAVVEATNALTDAQDKNKKASADYAKKQDAYFKSYKYTIDELKKPLSELEKQEEGYLNGVKSARESGNKAAEKVFQANVDRVQKEKKVYQDAIDKQKELAEAKFKASKGIPSGELMAKAKDPEIDKTKKGKTDAEKALEEAAEKEEKIRHALAQSEMSNIQKVTDEQKDAYLNREAAQIDSLLRMGDVAKEVYDSTISDAQRLTDEVVEKYNIAKEMFPEGIPEEWFKKVNEKFSELKENKLDTSEFIKFDDQGINKHFALIVNGIDKMKKAEKQYNENKAKYAKGSVQYNENEEEYQKSQIAGYANMAGAMSAMFKEGSREAEAFKAVQGALAIVEGASAVIKQMREGDVYSAIPRAVAVAGMVATTLKSAGIAFGGGGSSSTSSDAFSAMQANEGKGSVLGDVTAQSESIANSLDILGELAKPEFRLTSQMAKSLESIDSKIGGVAGLLLRQGGFAMGEGYEGFDTGYKNNVSLSSGVSMMLSPVAIADKLLSKIPILNMFSGITSGVIGSVMGKVFGKTSVSQSMTDSGLYFADALLKDAKETFEGSAYQTIKTTVSKKSLFKKSSSTSISTYFAGLTDEVERQFSLVLSQLYDTTVLAGDALDTSSTDVEKSLSKFVVSIGKISLKGKTGDQIQETLSAVFGKIGDDIALSVFPLLTPFQKVGEGLFETMTRVASGMEEAEYYVSRLGTSFQDIKYTDIVDKQGNVALEVLRQSILNLEGTSSGVSEIIQGLSGDVENLYSTYTALDRLRFSLSAIGTNTEGLTSSMLYGAGGIEALDDATQSYIENYLTESEKMAYNTAVMADAFKDIGLTIPTTKQGFTDLLKSIDVTTDGGQDLYGRLILLSEGFSSLVESSDKIKSALFDKIQTFVDSLTESLSSKDVAVTFLKFTTSFNDMVDAIANGSSDLESIGDTTLYNAKAYLNSVTATATTSRDIEFAKAMLINKFGGVLQAEDITLNNINTTLNNNNAVLVAELQALKFELNSIKNMTIDQTAITQNSLISLRGILSEVSSA